MDELKNPQVRTASAAGTATRVRNIIWASLAVCPPLGVGMLVGYFSSVRSGDEKNAMAGKDMLQLGLVIFAVVLALLVAGYFAGKSLATLEERGDSAPVLLSDRAEADVSPDS